MISKLSDWLLRILIRADAIENNKVMIDYYRYGFEITISSILNILLILLVGILSHSLKESFFFLGCFVPLRLVTGGYHANTYLKCNIMFVISYISLLIIYNLSKGILTEYAAIIMVAFSLTIFITVCPIENKNKPLSDVVRYKNKILSIILGTFYGVIGIVSKVLSYDIGVIFLYTLTLISLLVIAAILQDLRKEGHDEKS